MEKLTVNQKIKFIDEMINKLIEYHSTNDIACYPINICYIFNVVYVKHFNKNNHMLDVIPELQKYRIPLFKLFKYDCTNFWWDKYDAKSRIKHLNKVKRKLQKSCI